ncbi:MAG: efflux RND transporter permease subunit [Pseudomonadales bacterium]
MTKISIDNPAAIAVIALLILLFGVISIRVLPIQLLPDTEQPRISIVTNWRSAAPEEVEESIVQPQEKVLKNIEGLESMVSTISRGNGRIQLNFRVGWDMQRALIDVITQMNQASELPADADEPEVRSGGTSRSQAASLLIYTMPGNPAKDVANYQQLIDQEVEPRLARVPGVGRVNLAGEREQEISITLDAERMAARNIQISEVQETLRRAVDVSGGFADVGRRRYTVRFLGQRKIPQLDELVVAWKSGEPVYLREIAKVDVKLEKRQFLSRRNGFPAYYISMIPSFDANTVELLDSLNNTIDELNRDVLNEQGLIIELSFDASLHIRRAIALVQGNLLLGMMLASIVLWFFLRSYRATLLIAISIPISLLVAFIVLRFTGKTLNVISLAGLAFAVGLVMDAAIIVQENIIRLRETGLNAVQATLQGCREVSGALFSSTLTSIAIFVPILFMQGVEGQLFKDLAITLTAAVSVSLFTALTILPAATARWSALKPRGDPFAERWLKIAALVVGWTDTQKQRLMWVGGILGTSILLTLLLLPKVDFLPKANIDAVQTYFATPPGINIDTLEKEVIGEIVRRLKPHYDGDKEPVIRGYNIGSFGATDTFSYIYPQNPDTVDELIDLLRTDLFAGLADTQAFPRQSSMLNLDGDDGPSSISMDIQGADLDSLMKVAAVGLEKTQALWGDKAVVFSTPDLGKGEAELRLFPREQRISLAGLDRLTLANIVRAYTDGLFAAEYFDGNYRYDVILHGPPWSAPEELAAMPLATPLAGIQTIGELADIERGIGPSQLQRVDARRTVTIRLVPPNNVTMEEALQRLREEVEPDLKPLLPTGARIDYRGSADRLAHALRTIAVNFVLAILILFLIMAAMFKSPRDSLLVLLVMPMAVAGGVLGLKFLNLMTYQSLDLLTMIGFIILLGLVVNNAILLVDQTRSAQRNGMAAREAVHQAVLYRARPIFMSTLTSLFGMLPLMIIPGVGSEIYRGLATVIVGGMAFCALFTLVLLPSLLRMGEVKVKARTDIKLQIGEMAP